MTLEGNGRDREMACPDYRAETAGRGLRGDDGEVCLE